MTMLAPDDPGSGRLFFWTRQGISLQELYDIIAQVVAESPGGGPSGGGSSVGGTIKADQIEDGTDVGKAVLTAPGATYNDRQAASRAAMGAGTSDLIIGEITGTAADGGLIQSMIAAGIAVPPNGATGRQVFAAATPVEAKTVLSLQNVDNTADKDKPASDAQKFAISQAISIASQTFVLDSERNVANGVAGLDNNGTIVISALPSSVALFVRQDSVSGNWPPRPSWPGVVIWIGTSPAPGSGTTTSGTGMVDGLDIELLGA
jgi:hypothetical protein